MEEEYMKSIKEMRDLNEEVVMDLNKRLKLMVIKCSVGSRRRPAVAIHLLNKLWEEPITLNLLLKTKVGITVDIVRRLNLSKDVTELALHLITSWERLLPQNVLKERNRQKKTNYASDKVYAIEVKPNEEPKKSFKENNKSFSKNKSINKSLPKKPNPKKITTKKLPPIGQLPEYKAERERNRKEDEYDYESDPQPSTSTSFVSQPNTPNGTDSGLTGHEVYQKIVNKVKRKQNMTSISRMTSSTKRSKTFIIRGIDKYSLPPPRPKAYDPDIPKVENWPVPKTTPFITPLDRMRIIRARNEESKDKSSEPKLLKDDHELESGLYRVRSAKSFTTNIPRKEHRPKWLSK